MQTLVGLSRTAALVALFLVPALAAGQDTPTQDEPTTAAPTKPRKKKRAEAAATVTEETRVKIDAEGSVASGYLDGLGVREAAAPVVLTAAELEASFKVADFALTFPLAVEHRETLGEALRESRGEIGAEVGTKVSRALKLAADANVTAVLRPDWDDLYQPLPAGGFASTNRYSYWAGELGADADWQIVKRQYLRFGAELGFANYRDDPNYDAANEPTHLVPSDHSRRGIRLAYDWRGDALRVGAAVDATWKVYSKAYARDAGTGVTHAGAGGPPPNPAYKVRSIEPSVEVRWPLAGKAVTVGASYGYEIVDDLFDGYYSYRGHHPELSLRARTPGNIELKLAAALRWRRYGANSYAPDPAGTANPSHPPLDFGSRLVDRRMSAELGARVPLYDQLSFTVDVDWQRRSTNFPDYEAGVFPDTRQYNIDWDYDNWLATAGVVFTL